VVMDDAEVDNDTEIKERNDPCCNTPVHDAKGKSGSGTSKSQVHLLVR
jgi:hypothetical protein